MPDSQMEARDEAEKAPGAPPESDKLPRVGVPFAPEKPATPAPRPFQRNPILAELVQGEDDLAGLVGYALYKLHKRDWLASFFKTHGRDPTEGEIESYVLGERTQRRLATYRRLAEDVIGRKAGAIIDKASAAAAPSALQRVSALKGPIANSVASALGAPAAPKEFSQRSAIATLIFWIVVLIVLVAAGYFYVSQPSNFGR